MAIDIGRIAYTAYKTFLEEKDPDKWRTAPAWEDLPREEMDAWRHTGVAVIQHIDWESQDIECL